MFIKVNSTRKTAAGMFRAGRVYEVDEKQDAARFAAIKPHLGKGGAMARLTKAEAEAHMARAVEALGPGRETDGPAADAAAGASGKKGGKAQ